MSDIHMLEKIPVVQVKLEFVPSLAQLCETDGSERDILSQTISLKMNELLATLGIPGKTLIEMGASETTWMSGDQFFRTTVDGRRIQYPDELLTWTYAYVTESLANSATKLPDILEWLETICQAGQEAPCYPLLVEFFSLTCREAIRSQPEMVLGLPQAEAYRALLPPAEESELAKTVNWPPPAEWLLRVMKIVLNLGISLADIPKVANKIRETMESSPEDAAESLIAALRPDILEVHLPEEYLRTLTLDNPEKNVGMFPLLRDGLFDELGLVYPHFHFVINEGLKPGGFALKINNLLRLPQMGLQPDQCLVNDTQERLKLFSVEAIETRNPATQQPGSIAPIHDTEQLEGAGLTTWNIFGYLILCIAAELRKNSWCLTDQQMVQKSLEQLEMVFPALVSSVKAAYPLEQITRLLRALISEELSLRNLRLILERLLDY
ncbi:MAG: FHIPEP family type III secretion protein, partial [Chitinophagaceae bacterium]